MKRRALSINFLKSCLMLFFGSKPAFAEPIPKNSLMGGWKLLDNRMLQITFKNQGDEVYLVQVLQYLTNLRYTVVYKSGADAAGGEASMGDALNSLVPKSQGWALLWRAEGKKPATITIVRKFDVFAEEGVDLAKCKLRVSFSLIRVNDLDFAKPFPGQQEFISLELKYEADLP